MDTIDADMDSCDQVCEESVQTPRSSTNETHPTITVLDDDVEDKTINKRKKRERKAPERSREEEANLEGFLVERIAFVDTEVEVDTQVESNLNEQNLEELTDVDLVGGNDGIIVAASVDSSAQLAENDQLAQDSSMVELNLQERDEPYIGQEFESEMAAQEFYSAYGMRIGFNIRIRFLCRSKRDGTLTSRTFVCNKEGYRVSDKRDNKTSGNNRLASRVGCKAMLQVKKLSSGSWVITKFVKEHNHYLVPESDADGLAYNHTPTDDARVKALSKQLMVEKKRSASLQKIINVLFEHIENHTEHLSEKIQHIVDSVKEVDAAKRRPQKSR